MINKIGDFYIDEKDNERLLGIDSSKLDKCIKKYREEQFHGIFGYCGFGFEYNNLNFLEYFADVKKIWFWDVNLKNVEGLYFLKELQFFGLHGERPGIDFSNLSSITTISTDWISKDSNMSTCMNIENYYLWHHKPKEKSFERYLFPQCSNEVHINWSNVFDLTSLNGLQGMKRLEIHRSRNLVSLSGLEKYQDTLETIIITTCSKLRDYDYIKYFSALKLAIIDGKRVKG